MIFELYFIGGITSSNKIIPLKNLHLKTYLSHPAWQGLNKFGKFKNRQRWRSNVVRSLTCPN